MDHDRQQGRDTPPGTVFHRDEAGERSHESVLRNIRHLAEELADDSPIKLVVHGPGIEAVTIDSPVREQVEEAINRGVIVAACENTMGSRSLTTDDLIDGVVIVPAGIAEIVRKQRRGWSYARP